MADTTTGLIGYWKLDEYAGTIAYDSSGYVNDGDLVWFDSSPWVGGKLNGAIASNGAGNELRIGEYTFFSPQSVTYAAWINTTTLEVTGEDGVVSNGDNASLLLDVDTDTIAFYKYNGNSLWDKAENSVSDNIIGSGWRHVAGTFDSATKTLSVYIDGLLIDSTVSATQIDYTWNTTSGLTLCCIANGYTFDGLVDDARVYDRALLQEDIQALADMTKQPGPIDTTNLVSEWLFDEATTGTAPTTVNDDIGNAHAAISYTAGATWLTDSGAGLYYPNTTHGVGAFIQDLPTNASTLATALGSACKKATFIAVVKDIQGAVDWHRVFQLGNTSDNGDLTVTIDENDKVVDVRFGDDTPDPFQGLAFQFLNTTLFGGPHVIAVVVDTTQAVIDDRLLLYKNKVLQTKVTGRSGPNTFNMQVDFNRATCDLAFMNRPDGLRSGMGAIHYAAIFNDAVSPSQISEITDRLWADNDLRLGNLSGFSLINVDSDNIVYNGQANVALLMQEAGIVSGIVEFGGVVQNVSSWAATDIEIHPLDATGLDAGYHDMVVFKPK